MGINVKEWLAERAKELNLDESQTAIADKLLSSEKFRSDFVPVSDFHSALDKQRNKYESAYNEVVDVNQQWQQEYETRYGPALAAIERLEKAGYNVTDLKVNTRGDITNQGSTISLDDVEKLIDKKVEPYRAGTIDYATFVADKAVEYRETYGKRFDAEKYRKFGYENRDKYPTLESAYEAFTESERKAKEVDERKKWEKETEERIRLEIASNQSFPDSSGQMGVAPAFLASEQKNEVSDSANRAAFAAKFKDIGNISI